MIEFYVVTDRESENTAMSNNGGDYYFGRTIAVEDGTPVAVRYWTSADFDFCPICGSFDSHDADDCPCLGAEAREADGWEKGEKLAGDKRDVAAARFNGHGYFNPIRR